MILSVMEKLAPFIRHAMNKVTVEETETGSTRMLSSSLSYKKGVLNEIDLMNKKSIGLGRYFKK